MQIVRTFIVIFIAMLLCLHPAFLQPSFAYGDTTESYMPSEGLVPNKKVAIRIAEAVLFEIYGKKEIERQRPYNVKLVNGRWYIQGWLPRNEVGGTFEIVISQRNAEISMVAHSK